MQVRSTLHGCGLLVLVACGTPALALLPIVSTELVECVLGCLTNENCCIHVTI
jgi:hypothetical protein